MSTCEKMDLSDKKDIKEESPVEITFDSNLEEMNFMGIQLYSPYVTKEVKKEVQSDTCCTSTNDQVKENLHGMASKTTPETTPTLADKLETIINPLPPGTMEVQVNDQLIQSESVHQQAVSGGIVSAKQEPSPSIEEELIGSHAPVEVAEPDSKGETPLIQWPGAVKRRNGRGGNQKEQSFLYTLVRLAMKYGRPKDKQKLDEQLTKLQMKGYSFRPQAAFAPYYASTHPKVELGFQEVHKRFLKRKIWKAKYEDDQFMQISYICSIFMGLPDRNALFELLFDKTTKQFKDAQACLGNLQLYSTMLRSKWDYGEDEPKLNVRWLAHKNRGKK